jgi:hypothetical protein
VVPWCEGFYGDTEVFLERKERRLQGEFPHLNFGKVQEVVEDAQQRHRRRFQESEIFLLFRGKGGIEDKIGHADDAVHRCTDFMADIG